MSLTPGARLGTLEILGLLGAGGMGEVYRARDVRLGREVAIKVLPASVADDPERRARFEREARAASSLNHPGIVTIHGFDSWNGQFYLVMERIEGRSLRELISSGPLPMPRILSIGIQIAQALAAAHAAGIVHRDLKPSNVMVLGDGRVKILDFGLAKFTSPTTEDAHTETDAPNTGSGVVMGTVGYMSPEQAGGREVDLRADQFSLGAILYEMAAGRRAFRGVSTAETLAAILKEEPAPLEPLAPAVPARLVQIITRCLTKDRARRYHSTRDLARELEEIDRGLADASTAAQRMPPARHRPATRWAAVALGLTVAATGAAVRFGRNSSPPVAAVPTPSIAILPFVPFGPTQDDYFTDGITEAIITDVARTRDVLVIARNSVFQYKGHRGEVRRIGRDLGVRYVLEGSVQRAGNRLRLNAQLIDVATGFNLWAERYDREIADVFGVQDDLSRRIVQAVMAAVKAPSAPAVALAASPKHSPPTTSLEAYDAFLRGRYHAEQFSWAEKDKSLPWLERAVSLDPRFAEAQAALAAQYARKFFETDDREWEAKAFLAIEKALADDPQLPGPYVTRGALLWTSGHGFSHLEAAAAFRRALAMSPNDADAHGQLGSVYLHVGLLEEAMREYEEALRRSPGNPAWIMRVGRIHLFRQDPQRALDEFRKHPDVARASMEVALALDRLGRGGEAREHVEKLLRSPRESFLVTDARSAYAVILARAGETARAEEHVLRALRETPTGSHFHHAAYNIASTYAVMRRKREALQWLRRTADEGMPCYPLFAKDENLDPLRGDAEFEAFLREQRALWDGFRASL